MSAINDLIFNELDDWQQISVGAALVTRMYSNYALFCDVTDFVEASRFRAMLDVVWEFAAGLNDAVDFEKQQAKLVALTPNSEQYELYGVWPAMDATTGLMALLSLCQEHELKELSSIIKLSESTIDHFAQFRGDEELLDILLNDQAAFLEDIIVHLQRDSSSVGRKVCVRAVKAKAFDSTSNIGLSLK